MGFGALFIGYMFLYDLQLVLRHNGAAEAYAMLDMFPDVVGWILIFFGLRALSKRAEGFELPRRLSVFFVVLSLLTLAKDTLLFESFYAANVQSFAGEVIDFCVHLCELAFTVLLFGKTAKLCRKYGEDKLSFTHANVPRIAMMEGIVFVVARVGRFLMVPQSAAAALSVISMLDFIFTVFMIWYAVIALFRTMVRISDL